MPVLAILVTPASLHPSAEPWVPAVFSGQTSCRWAASVSAVYSGPVGSQLHFLSSHIHDWKPNDCDLDLIYQHFSINKSQERCTQCLLREWPAVTGVRLCRFSCRSSVHTQQPRALRLDTPHS